MKARSEEMREIAVSSLRDETSDYKPLDYLPDVIDSDIGFFLMFGTEDQDSACHPYQVKDRWFSMKQK